ncbi:hypothetical protein ACF0H5_007741 [Mactra antiquata]
MFLLFLLGCILVLVQGQTNLIHNGDFETTSYNGNWYCIACTLTSDNDAYQGQHSVHVSNRHQNWAGAAQNLQIQGNEVYKASGRVKLWNTHDGSDYQEVTFMLACKDGSGKNTYSKFGSTSRVKPGQWYEIGGALRSGSGSHSCHIYVQTPAPTDYALDSVTVVHIPHDSNWKSHANQRINANRKADITISLAGAGVDSSSVDIELKQDKMEFIMGSEVPARLITGSNHAFQDVFYKNFEWGVLENALKWGSMEHSQGHINYNTPLLAMDTMISHGIKLRCHCAFWDVDKNVQQWVKNLDRTHLLSAINDRIDGVVGRTHGKCEQWDVNNEMFHGSFFEKHTGNPDITMDMFRRIHSKDSHPDLYLNDYSVISGADSATEMKDFAMKYKQAGVPIGGIGVQGHLHMFDVEVIKARLDILAEAGLPIMVTEFAINERDENKKASHLVDVMTMLFSHPSVKGILFWGFWDQDIWEHDAPLYTGSNVTPNAAGRAYENLFHNTWRTHVTHTISGHQQYHVRGFKGDYTLTVKHNGHTLKTEHFTLTDGGKNVEVHLDGNNGVSHVIVG